MSQYVELASKAGDQYLEILGKAQDTSLQAIAQFTKQMPQLPMSGRMPAEVGPAVREAAEASLAFAQKALDQQKVYVEKLLATTGTVVAEASA
ncbi:MAG TPA: hypothetical protein VHN80_01350 [Kineosporiaceae bacterium]|nr:hypothetical protein [Kineosporiaceae bacterium]